jgi:beta-galactosidase
MSLYRIDPRVEYYDYMYNWSEFHRWGMRNGTGSRNADDQCCAQTYIDLYRLSPDSVKIRDIIHCINGIVNTPDVSDWTWIDAIQMAMPVYAQLGSLTGDGAYYEKMYQMYAYTRNVISGSGLFNSADGLWYRDADFLPPYKEPNGANCYWSRGNGWVYAALARVLSIIPEDAPHRSAYVSDFLTMSSALIRCQRADGFWNVSLHDSTHYGGKESTGTSLFLYGLSWGINNCLLESATYLPHVLRAWEGLTGAVHPDGFLGWVQSTGKEPKDGQPVGYDRVPDFEDFGIGCFLLGGSETYRLLSGLPAEGTPVRTVENFNFGWRFHLGDIKDGERVDLDDSGWRLVDLPHDFQIEQPWVTPAAWGEGSDTLDIELRKRLMARGFKAMNSGWYRKTFTPDSLLKGRRVLIDFEGIMLVGDVWLNGERIGGTDYGYCGFEIDITAGLRWGEPNILSVRANTGDLENSRWYTGGGLFRDVHLITKDAGLSFARHAIYITTPQVTDESAVIRIQSEIENCSDRELTVGVRVCIFDPAGREVSRARTELSLNRAHRAREYPLKEMEVMHPRRWSCETPELYRAEVTLYDETGRMTDRIVESFGIRTIEYSPSFGLRLNGKKVLLKGNANHNELGALGVAAYERAIEKRFQLMKSFGMNHVRCSHNPYSKSFMELADRYGILVVDEVFDKWTRRYVGGRAEWWDVWPYAVSEWIRRDRNHPSVVMWSLGNELQTMWENAFHDWGVTPYRMQEVLVKRYDDTRPVTVAMFPRRRYGDEGLPAELALATEIASYNYRYMYFRGDSKKFPHLIFYQSEASVSGMGPNFWGMPLDSVIGLAYWGLIDYLGESHGWSYKGWQQGVFKIDLRPKPQAYLLKSMFCADPVVHMGIVLRDKQAVEWNEVNVGTTLMIDHWNLPVGSVVSLFTYTNAEEVELLINGHSLGRKRNDVDDYTKRNQIRWDSVTYRRGEITAVAYNKGTEVARHHIESTGRAVRLLIEPDTNRWLSTGLDLKHVRIYAVDARGRRVPESNELLTFEVFGDARIVALDNGDHRSDELHAGDSRRLYEGSALVILRSGRVGGEVRLRVSGAGYRPVESRLLIEPPHVHHQ